MSRLLTLGGLGAGLLVTGITVDSAGLLYAGIILIVLVCLAALSLLWMAATFRCTVTASTEVLHRGDNAYLNLSLTHRCPLPSGICSVEAVVDQDRKFSIESVMDCGKALVMRIPAKLNHVGSYQAVHSGEVILRDLLNLGEIRRSLGSGISRFTVLPNTFEMEDVALAVGDSGLDTMARATEDITNPTEIRSYIPGDALKKVHWKLTARKRELMIRKFEEPMLPDTLILLDTSPPPESGDREQDLDLKDCLLETAASAMAHEIEAGHEPRMPVRSRESVECDKSMGLVRISRVLAEVDFLENLTLPRLLMLETRRIRQTGAVMVVTARLDGESVELLIRMRRMGPTIRLYLATEQPDSAGMLPAVVRLQSADVAVRYVTPAAADSGSQAREE